MESKGKAISTTPTVGSTDTRFAAIGSSAIHRLPPKQRSRVVLDSRFSRVLEDERFASHAKVDRYGRRLQTKRAKRSPAIVHSSNKSSKSDDKTINKNAWKASKDHDSTLDEHHSDDEASLSDASTNSNQSTDANADDTADSSSSSEYSSSDEDEVDDVDETETLGLSTEDIPEGKVSSRLAVVNLDWDHIRAADLLAVFSSFARDNCRILRVSVYPSEFGKARMERENLEGPPAEIFANRNNLSVKSDESDDSSNSDALDDAMKKSLIKEDDGKDFDSVKLRKYQLERLRYFYAVVECSSAQGAKKIYDLIDGTEYLASANFFDLRFIPTETDFTHDSPRDVCDQLPDRYHPTEFVTDALQHSKVKLSWDADDPRRAEVQKRAFSAQQAESDEQDLRAFIASSSSEDDDQGDHPREPQGKTAAESRREAERSRVRGLLGLASIGAKPGANEVTAAGDMEVTFTSGLSTSGGASRDHNPAKSETTLEKYIRKEKEKKSARRRGANADSVSTSVQASLNNTATEDLGFDDPFFTAPGDTDQSAITRKRNSRERSRARESDDNADNSNQRAELELLLADETSNLGDANHFDKRQLKARSKALNQGKRKGRYGGRDPAEISVGQEGFKMNVSDPRFKAVYEKSDFAVDPSHPKFDRTDGMVAVLEESRRKRMRTKDVY